MKIYEGDYNLVGIDAPCDFRACTVYDAEADRYSIIYNRNISVEALLRAYEHEIEHIENDDVHSTLTVSELENLRHK